MTLPPMTRRAPAGYVGLYPIENVSAPSQLTLDKSIDPVAYTVCRVAPELSLPIFYGNS